MLLCLLILSTTPKALINTISELEPALIKGKGKPVGGIEPVTTAMFIKVWIAIILVIPVAR